VSMAGETFVIEIDGEELSEELYCDLISLEVELDDELASMFRLKFAIMLQPDGTWTYLDDERFKLWKEVTFSAGFETGTEELMVGYITHLKPNFDPDETQCTLEIWGMDGSVLMDRVEKLKDWPNKKDSDIAAELFGLYGLTPEVEDTTVIHDEAISTIIQRETDIQFLQRLALRNGYDCYVAGRTGYFRPPQVDETPQPILAVHFGEETNVINLSLEMNALTPVDVAMFQIDRLNKEVLEATAESSRQTALGSNNANSLLTAGMDPAQLFVGKNAATGLPEMNALCQGLYHEADWFVSGEGEIIGNKYQHVLLPRHTVTIKGIAEIYSGVYYVSHVTHSFSGSGYTQTFRVRRNGINPTGDENFTGGNGLLGGLL
jgi:phage protein D